MSKATEVRRRHDGRVIKPSRREPDCIHPFTHDPVTHQPASACRDCREGEPLARWKAEWSAWAEENPHTYDARVHRGEITHSRW